MPTTLKLTESTALPAWTWNLASYAGSWAGGAGLGYVVARSKKGAVTGGLAASGIWAASTAIVDRNVNHPAITAGLFGVSALSLYTAWTRR